MAMEIVQNSLFSEASNNYGDMTDEFLKINYIPDVYQKSIYTIDYDKLKSNGIKLISYDIDNTIAGDREKNPPKSAVTLFENLRNLGFTIVLLTNNNDQRGKHFGEILGVKYIANGHKPLTSNFKKILKDHGMECREMIHVGNNQLDDVAGGNILGIFTCLVQNVDGSKIGPEETKLRDELSKRNIWKSNSKFYQLKEKR